jgi:hypothetical protein
MMDMMRQMDGGAGPAKKCMSPGSKKNPESLEKRPSDEDLHREGPSAA